MAEPLKMIKAVGHAHDSVDLHRTDTGALSVDVPEDNTSVVKLRFWNFRYRDEFVCEISVDREDLKLLLADI